MPSQMNVKAVFTPVINNSLIQAQGATSGAIYANSFKQAFSKVQPLGRITGAVSEFQKSMEASNARVIAFGASAGSIYLIKTAIDKLISSSINVQKNLANINVILGLGNTALKSFSNEMFKAASQSGQTFETASKVALEFARHGVSAAETAKRMTSAMQLMRISGLDAEDSVNVITAAINAFNKEGLTSADIVNRLTAVDTKFAISAQDLAKAIQRVGSTAEDAGVHFNQLLGLVTAAQTATARGGAVIGNAFKSIFTRLSRPQVLDDLQAIGVQVKDANNQILPMITILKNLAGSYNTLNSAQKSFITEAVGGVYQVNILKASLADLGNGVTIFDKASIAASQSTGLIDDRMSQLNETISSKLNTSVNELTKLFSSFGQIAFADKAQSGLQSFNEQIQSISKTLEDIQPGDSIIEKIKKTLGSGLAQGLGSLISGPGIQAAVAIVIKSIKTLLEFVQGIAKDFLGMNTALHRQEILLESAGNFLARNKDLIEQAATGQITMNQLMAEYVRQVQQAAHAHEIINNLTTSLAKGANTFLSVTPHTPSSGYIPNFSEADAERIGATRHGYLAGATYKRNIFDGQGNSFTSTINQAETVHDFTNSAGFKATIVMPPNGFGADTMRAASGFIPNFGENEDIVARYRNTIQNLHAFNLKIEEELIKHGASKEQASVFKKGIFRTWKHGEEEPPVSQFLLKMLQSSTGNRGVELLNRFKHEQRLNNELFGQTLGMKNVDFSLVEQRMEDFRNQKKINANGFVPNFALDKVFSVAMKKSKIENRGDNRSFGGKILGEHGREFEKAILKRAEDYGFTMMKPLNKIISDNVESDFYAERNGVPWLLDAKYTPGGESTKASQLADKERTMKSFWEKAQDNPEILSKIDPRLLQEEFKKNMHFGVITTPVLNRVREKSLEAEGIEHEYLKALFAGFTPNFAKETLWRGVGGRRLEKYKMNREVSPEILHNMIFDPPNPSEEFKDLIREAFHSKRGVDIGAVQYLLQRHTHEEVGGSGGIHSGLLSTSRNKDYVAKFFAKKDASQTLGSIDLQSSRIYNPERWEKLLKKVGPTKLSKILEGPRQKFVGFDINAFLGQNSKLPEEQEVALYSRGFIPNFNPIQDAIGREMGAGYSASQIRVGKDNSLIASNNPQGLGVYNSTEGSLSNGISLAKAAGINPQTKGMSSGFVPNFDLESTLLLGVLQVSMSGLNQKISALSIGYDKEISQKQEAYEAFDKLLAELRATPASLRKANDEREAQKSFIKKYGFNPVHMGTKEAHQKSYEDYEFRLRKIQTTINSASLKGMIGAPIAGGLLSSTLQNFGKEDQAKAVSTLTEGVTEAAQALFALPNAAGAAIGGFLLFSKIGDTISQWNSKAGEAAKALDIQKTFLEKSSSALSSLQNSYDSLNSMFESGQTDLQSFLNITKHITESMTELAAISPDLARKLSLAGTPEERQKISAQFIDEQSLKTKETDFNAAFQKMITEQKKFGVDIYKNSSEGEFTAGNSEEVKSKDAFKTTAALLVQSQILNAFSKSNNPAENKIIKNLASGEGTTNDLNAIIANLNKSSIFQGLGDSEQKAIKERLINILEQIVIPPEQLANFKKNRDELQSQQRIELEARKRYNQELQGLIAKGTILSSYNNQAYGASLQQKGAQLGVQYSQASGQIRLESLFTSESAIAAKRGTLEQQKILLETPLKQEQRTIQGAEEIGKMIGDEIKTLFPEPTKVGGQESYASPLLDTSKFLSKRQALFSGAKGADLFALAQKSPEEFVKGFLGPKTNEINTGNYNKLSETLTTLAESPAFKENIGKTLLDIQKIVEDAKNESQKQNDETVAAIKEIDFKELVSSLGGLGLLTNKTAAREMHRRITRDEYLEQHGHTSEQRGRAAVDLLQLIPEGKRDRNSPYIQNLLNQGVSGMQGAETRALRNTNLGTHGFFNGAAEARIYGNIRTFNSSEADSRAKSLGLDITGNVPNRGSTIDVSPLTTAVNQSATDLDYFASKLKQIGDNLPQLSAHVTAAETTTKAIVDKMGASYPRPSLNSPHGVDASIGARKWAETGIAVSEAALGTAAIAAGRNIYKTRSFSKGLEKSFPARNFHFRIGSKGMTPEQMDIEAHMRAIAEEEKMGDFTTANETRKAFRNKYSPEEAVKILGKKKALDVSKIVNQDKILMPKGATPEASPLEDNFPVPKSWRGEGGKFISPNVSKYTSEEIKALTTAGKLGKFAQYGGAISKGLGALNVGFGAYSAYKDWKVGNKWSAAEDIGETALAFSPARPLLAPLDVGKIGYHTYKMAHATHQQQISMNNLSLQEQGMKNSSSEQIQKLYSLRGNKQAINEYINENATGQTSPTTQTTPEARETLQKTINTLNNQQPNLKVEDGNLTITLDLSKVKQQINERVSVAVANAVSDDRRPPRITSKFEC